MAGKFMGSRDMYKKSAKPSKGEKEPKELTEAEKTTTEENGEVGSMPTHESSMGVPSAARHAMERMDIHSKHEHEHHTHDHGNHGDKKEMHERHHTEMKSMMKRHEKELLGDGDAKGEKE